MKENHKQIKIKSAISILKGEGNCHAVIGCDACPLYHELSTEIYFCTAVKLFRLRHKEYKGVCRSSLYGSNEVDFTGKYQGIKLQLAKKYLAKYPTAVLTLALTEA